MPCFFLFGFLVCVQDAEGFFIGGAGVGTVIVGLGEPTVCSRRVTIVIIGGVIIHSCPSRTTLVTIVIIIRAEISRLILILLLLPLLLIRRWLLSLGGNCCHCSSFTGVRKVFYSSESSH